MTTEYADLAGTFGDRRALRRMREDRPARITGESEETYAKDGSGKNPYRNSGEGAAGDDADSVTMILPGRGYELVRFQCEPLYLTAMAGLILF